MQRRARRRPYSHTLTLKQSHSHTLTHSHSHTLTHSHTHTLTPHTLTHTLTLTHSQATAGAEEGAAAAVKWLPYGRAVGGVRKPSGYIIKPFFQLPPRPPQ